MDLFKRILYKINTLEVEEIYRWARDNDHAATVGFYLSSPGSMVEFHTRLIDSTNVPDSLTQIPMFGVPTATAELWWAVILRYALVRLPASRSIANIASTMEHAGGTPGLLPARFKEFARALATWLSSVEARGQAVSQAARSAAASEEVMAVFKPLFRHRFLDWIESGRTPENEEYTLIEHCIDTKWKYSLVLAHLAAERAEEGTPPASDTTVDESEIAVNFD